MGSLFSLLGVARDALLTQQSAVNITGQNVANVNTPGYVRRAPRIEERAVPGGVTFGGVSRILDRVSFAHLVSEGGKRAAAEGRAGALAGVEGDLASGSSSIADRVQALFDGFSALATNADDTTARSAVLARATDLATTVSGAATSLASARTQLFAKAQIVAGEINERLSRIAKLNEQIVVAKGSGDEAPQLRDERGQLVRELGERIGVNVLEDDTGQLTVLSGGVALVDGQRNASIQVGLSGAGDMTIAAQPASGSPVDITSRVDSGTLGGLLEARDLDVPALQVRLDQFAYELATGINALHASGYGLDGATGRPLFVPPAAVTGAAAAFAVDPSVLGQPDAIAAATQPNDLPGGNDLALALGGLGGTALIGSSTPAEALGAMMGDLGLRKASADSEVELRTNTVAQSEALNESASGVSIDEEMVNLTRFQRAFEAAMRVLQTADDLLSGLMKDL